MANDKDILNLSWSRCILYFTNILKNRYSKAKRTEIFLMVLGCMFQRIIFLFGFQFFAKGCHRIFLFE